VDDPQLAFVTDDPAAVRINFGIFAGRQATPAEIDVLAHDLYPIVGDLSIVAEERHEIGANSEAALASVRVELEGMPPASLADELVARCNAWARTCIAERHADIADL
jgi:hypothetical protein